MHAAADSAAQIVAEPHGAANHPAARSDRADRTLRIESREAHDFSNLLWAVAIGTAFLFAAMAAAMVFG